MNFDSSLITKIGKDASKRLLTLSFDLDFSLPLGFKTERDESLDLLLIVD